MESKNPTQLNIDKVAVKMGWDQINLIMAQEEIDRLTEENQKLNQMLAEVKLEKHDKDS